MCTICTIQIILNDSIQVPTTHQPMLSLMGWSFWIWNSLGDPSVHACFVRWLTDSLMFFCAMIKLQGFFVQKVHPWWIGCLWMPYNSIYGISYHQTLLWPFLFAKKWPGVNEPCASVWWLQGMSRYVSLLLFRMPVDAEHGLLGTSPGLPMEFRNFPWNMGSSYRFSLKPQRKWGFHHGPLGSARLPRWLPGQWRKRPQGPKSTTFPGRQGLEVVNSHGYDPSHGATPDHHPSH